MRHPAAHAIRPTGHVVSLCWSQRRWREGVARRERASRSTSGAVPGASRPLPPLVHVDLRPLPSFESKAGVASRRGLFPWDSHASRSCRVSSWPLLLSLLAGAMHSHLSPRQRRPAGASCSLGLRRLKIARGLPVGNLIRNFSSGVTCPLRGQRYRWGARVPRRPVYTPPATVVADERNLTRRCPRR